MKEHGRLRFNTDQDVRLLELALEINPFENPNRWQRLHEIFIAEFKKPHTLRAVRDHLDIIIKQFIKGFTKGAPAIPEYCSLIEQVIGLKKHGNAVTVAKQKKSGEHSSENGQFSIEMSDGSQSVSSASTSNPDKKLTLHLLTCRNPQNCDCKNQVKWDVAVTAQDQDYSFNFIPQGEVQEGNYQNNDYNNVQYNNVDTFMNSESNNPELSDSTVLAYLKSKFSIEKETKEKEIALEERKLALKEKELELQKEKFELDRLERSKRLEIELKERELHMKVIEQQQNLINMYMKTNQFKM